MKLYDLKHSIKQLRLLVVVGALAVAASGCAVNGGQLVTDVVEAALNSATTSIVNALSEQLARN